MTAGQEDLPDDEPYRQDTDLHPRFWFTPKMAREYPVQIWYDVWRRRDRTVRFMGRCIVCKKPTWSFDDGENDPRGVLGDQAYWSVELEQGGEQYEITTCAICANDHACYLRAKELAELELQAARLGLPSRYRSVVVRRVK